MMMVVVMMTVVVMYVCMYVCMPVCLSLYAPRGTSLGPLRAGKSKKPCANSRLCSCDGSTFLAGLQKVGGGGVGERGATPISGGGACARGLVGRVQGSVPVVEETWHPQT
eukprot:6170493-Pyramimonas_sp.AAC.1